MSIEKAIMARSNNQCELCKSTENLSVYDVPGSTNNSMDESIVVLGSGGYRYDVF
jgi:protein PhnA